MKANPYSPSMSRRTMDAAAQLPKTIQEPNLPLARHAQFLSSQQCSQDLDCQTSTVGYGTPPHSWGTLSHTCRRRWVTSVRYWKSNAPGSVGTTESRDLNCSTHPDQAYLARPSQGESVEAEVFGTTLTSIPRS